MSQRGLSGHTVLAYRDTLKLFLEFVCRLGRKTCTDLTLEDLTATTVRAFLDHLERVRKKACGMVQMSAIHSLCQKKSEGESKKVLANRWSGQKIKRKAPFRSRAVTKWEISVPIIKTEL